MTGLLPSLKPLPTKERISVVSVEYGEIDMLDSAFVVVDANGIRTHIPVGGVACGSQDVCRALWRFPTCLG